MCSIFIDIRPGRASITSLGSDEALRPTQVPQLANHQAHLMLQLLWYNGTWEKGISLQVGVERWMGRGHERVASMAKLYAPVPLFSECAGRSTRTERHEIISNTTPSVARENLARSTEAGIGGQNKWPLRKCCWYQKAAIFCVRRHARRTHPFPQRSARFCYCLLAVSGCWLPKHVELGQPRLNSFSSSTAYLGVLRNL